MSSATNESQTVQKAVVAFEPVDIQFLRELIDTYLKVNGLSGLQDVNEFSSRLFGQLNGTESGPGKENQKGK